MNMRFSLPLTLHAGLSPGAVELAARDWRGRWLRRERHAVAGAPGWRAALAALQAQVAQGDWRGGSIEVVLSTHFVRHCLLPADAGIKGAAEQAAYVKHLFRGEYGDEVDGWRVAIDRAGTGARLAGAADAGLLDETAAACRAGGLRLRSVRPHLVDAANGLCRRIGRRRAWLAVLEDDVCALALCDAGAWRHVARARLNRTAGASLFAVLRQQVLMLPEEPAVRALYVCGDVSGLDCAAAAGDWDIEIAARPPGLPAGLLSF